jgi:DNA (cytosine-5)-methyltransferase 1
MFNNPRKNFPNTTMHNQCANILLERAINQYEHGHVLQPIKDLTGEPMADLPAKDAIDLIYCGPPWFIYN